MTHKQKHTIVALMWMLFVVLCFLVAAARGSFGATITGRRHRQHKVRVVVDSLYVKFGYKHGDLLAVFLDRSSSYNNTAVMIQNPDKLLDIETVTLCGGTYTKQRLDGLVGKSVLLAYSRQFDDASDKCHLLIGILPTEPGQ